MTAVIRELLALDKTTGDVGVEIEIEGKKLPREVNKYWRVDNDGSLRGEAFEYVLAKPLTPDMCFKSLDLLHKELTAPGVVVNDTVRAGIHIHVNYQEYTAMHVLNSLIIYFIVEDLLTHICGKTREGNLFCLRSSDAEAIILDLLRLNGDFTQLGNDNYRYAAVNLKALKTYGSLEYRAMRSTIDMDGVVKPWISLLLKIREKCTQYASPADILNDYSQRGAEEFLKFIFDDAYQYLVSDMDIRSTLTQSVWRVQMLAFSIKPEEIEARLGKPQPPYGTSRAAPRREVPVAPAVGEFNPEDPVRMEVLFAEPTLMLFSTGLCTLDGVNVDILSSDEMYRSFLTKLCPDKTEAKIQSLSRLTAPINREIREGRYNNVLDHYRVNRIEGRIAKAIIRNRIRQIRGEA